MEEVDKGWVDEDEGELEKDADPLGDYEHSDKDEYTADQDCEESSL